MRICVLLILSFWSSIAFGNVTGVVEHSTPANVTQAGGAGTEITVTVNTPSDQISHNTYTYFNVPEYGVKLDNSAANARMIINEVTSTGNAFRSSLEGPLTVQGARAHVILANPNGISVNGGSFVNISTMMLSTGEILAAQNVNLPVSGSDTLLNDPYYVIKTTTGDVAVGSGSFSGVFPRLDIISKSLSVTDADLDLLSTVMNVQTGTTTTVLRDGSEIPLPTIAQDQPIYHEIVAGNCSTSGANTDCTGVTAVNHVGSSYLVDVTGMTSLNAGAINITVNDVGAGFHFAGVEMAAEDGQISITTPCEIILDSNKGGILTAERDLTLDAENYDITLNGSAGSQKTITAGEDLTVDAGTGDVINNGYTLQSELPADSTGTLNGGVSITAADFFNRSLSDRGLAIVYSSSGKVSSNDLTIVDEGGGDFSLDNRDTGGVTITASGDVFNESGRIVSNNGVTINVGGDLYNRVIRNYGSNTPIITEKTNSSRFLIFRADRKITTFDYGIISGAGQASYIQAARGDIQLNFTASGNTGNLYNIGGEINADGGMDYRLVTTTIDHSGNDTSAAGGANDTMTVTNSSTGDSFSYTVTGTETSSGNGINNGQELLISFIEAFNTYRASSGRFSDLRDVEVVRVSETADADNAYGLVFGSEQVDDYNFVYNDSSGGSDTAVVQDMQSDGTIYIGTSSDADNNLNAVHNQVVLSGAAERNSKCFFFCDQSGFDTVVSTGGLISAQNQLSVTVDGAAADTSFDAMDLSANNNLTGSNKTITGGNRPADGYIVNLGGRMTALNKNEDNNNNAIDIQSASSNVNVIAQAQRVHRALVRDQGILAQGYARIYSQDQGGSFTANMGRLNFTNLADIRIIAGDLSGGTDGDEIYSGGSQVTPEDLDSDIVYAFSESPNFGGRIGMTNGILSLF